MDLIQGQMLQHVTGALIITIVLPLVVAGFVLMIVVGSADELIRYFFFHDSVDDIIV